MPYIGNSPGTGTRNRFIYTATASQTTFSGADDNGKTLKYADSDYVDVYLNGICLVPVTDYTSTSKTSIVLTQAASLNDTLEVVAYDIATISDTVSKADGGNFEAGINVDGNVGIGTTSPNATLSLGTASPQITFLDSANTSAYSRILGTDNGSLIISADEGNAGAGSSTINFEVDTTERMRIDDSGNVGISTNDPKARLEVEDNGSTTGVILKVTADDSGPYALVVGNDTFSTSDTNGMAIWVGNSGAGTIAARGTGAVMRFRIDTSEAMRIDNNRNFLVGTTSPDPSAPSNNVVGTAIGASGYLSMTRDGAAPAIFNRKTSHGIVTDFRKDGTSLGDIGTRAGFLNIGSGDVGVEFHATDNTVYPSQGGGGNYALTNGSINLGGGSYRWATIYAATGSINTSDENQKQQVASLTNAELIAATAISKLFKTFKWNDAVEEKGDAARIHAGVIAQQVEQAMTDAGLDASKYGFFCRDTVYETFTEVPAVEADEENGIAGQAAFTKVEHYHSLEEAPEGAVERTTKGVRYAELLSFIGAATEQRLTSIEARLDALEAG